MHKQRHSEPHVAVLVLGEIGQSPRSLYHVTALHDAGACVSLIAYMGDVTPPSLRGLSRVQFYPLSPPIVRSRHRLPAPIFLAYALCRAGVEFIRLAWTLTISIEKPDFIFAQTPPAIPTIIVGLLARCYHGARFVLDWHNYSYSLLAMRLGETHVAVRFVRWYEKNIGRRADLHLCVSSAMQADLKERFDIHHVTTLHDRPGVLFRRATSDERQLLFERITPKLSGTVAQKLLADLPDRPAVVVTGTSWTIDEDLGLLLDALKLYDENLGSVDGGAEGKRLPDLVVFVTGRGPLRATFEQRISDMTFVHVKVHTLWLSFEDYALLLGSADLGLSLHRSSSGVDLPMKVLDMLGAGLPLLALDYGPCLREILQPHSNGVMFSDAIDLSRQLGKLLAGFPRDADQLNQMREFTVRHASERWDCGWNRLVRPMFFNEGD